MPSIGKDLAALRNKKGLSLDELKQSTRLPVHILQSIEDDSIFERMGSNTTYVRSYVRSYAKAVGIKEAKIVHALNRVETNSYDGSLGVSTASSSESTIVDDPPNPDDAPQKSEADASAIKGDMRHDHSPEYHPQKSSEPEFSSQPKSRKSASKSAVSSLNWADVGRKTKPGQSKSRNIQWLLIFLLIVAILAGIYFIYNYYQSEGLPPDPVQNNSEAVQPSAPSDSLRRELIDQETEPTAVDNTSPIENGSLADTLSIEIYAANGKLEPVRIFTDILKQQNPYWIPQGDTMVFPFVNTVRIRAVNQYNRLQILFNDQPIQNYYERFYNTESGIVEIDRSLFEDDPRWRTPADAAGNNLP